MYVYVFYVILKPINGKCIECILTSKQPIFILILCIITSAPYVKIALPHVELAMTLNILVCTIIYFSTLRCVSVHVFPNEYK